jgi:hypothetical protein
VTPRMRSLSQLLSSSGAAVRRSHAYALLLLWGVFLLRAAFYLSITPLWEGFDEHVHYGYIDLVGSEGRLPIGLEDRVSDEVTASLGLLPLPWEPRGFQVGLTHDEYWKLDERSRKLLQDGFRELRAGVAAPEHADIDSNPFLAVYESQHPPLYYLLAAIPYRLTAGTHLVNKVFLLRLCTVLLTSLLIPAGFLLLLRVFPPGESLLLLWVIVFVPGLMFDVVRIANDGLAVVLFTVLVFTCTGRNSSTWKTLAAGVVLGLGLMTKSYFLAAVAPAGLALATAARSETSHRTRAFRLGITLIPVIALSGWWYLWNYYTVGNITGIFFHASLERLTAWQMMAAIPQVDWWNAVNVIFNSHVWFGNWSFLSLRSWIYEILKWTFAAGAVGAALQLKWRSGTGPGSARDSRLFFLFYSFFWLGLLYHVLVTHLATGISATGGWYLGTVLVIEVAIGLSGLAFLLRSSARTGVLPGIRRFVPSGNPWQPRNSCHPAASTADRRAGRGPGPQLRRVEPLIAF